MLKLIHLRTRTRRLFSVLFVGSIVGFSAYLAITERIIQPKQWYFYTTDGGGFDLNSPTNRNIVSMANYLDNPRYKDKCEYNLIDRRGAFGAEYRGIKLCNTADFHDTDFDIAHTYFKTKVDNLYSSYNDEVVNRSVRGFLYGICCWFVLATTYGIAQWIRRGDDDVPSFFTSVQPGVSEASAKTQRKGPKSA